MTIAMQDRAAAQNWESKATDLNERAEQAVQKAAQIVQEINEMADGTLIDELYQIGGTLSTVAASLLTAMNAIIDVVNNLLSAVEELIEKGKGFLDQAFSTIQ
ncbi:MAG: hypothetical protein LIO62_00595 [Clostridiales bacterium]|nr:hypothetical protein [Clostridiales bacterium]